MGRKVVNKAGQRYGKLLVLHENGRSNKGFVLFKVRCDCGKEYSTFASCLTSRGTKSCGCDKQYYKDRSVRKIKDITGQKFGRVKVLSLASSDKRGAYFNCLCDCGVKFITKGRGLRSGRTKSCGCFHQQAVKTHGCSDHPDFKCWSEMIHRCHSPTTKAAKHYRDRGITVCERWRSNPQNFFDDMGPRPEGYSIERLNGDDGYNPENCIWANHSIQQNNRSNNRWFKFDNYAYNMKQLCELLKLNYSNSKSALHRGKPLEIVFNKDVLEIEYSEAMKIKYKKS